MLLFLFLIYYCILIRDNKKIMSSINENNKNSEVNINSSMNIEDKENIYKKIKSSICKILINNNKEGYGFFCQIMNRNKSNIIPVLITNYTTLSIEYIKTNENIKLLLNEDQEIKNIPLDDSRINYTNEEINITIIGINPKTDGINSFLEIDNNIFEDNLEKIIKNIYIIEKPHFKRDFISISPLKKINSNLIEYEIKTAFGCIGTPIFNLENNKIIGIHMNEIENKENKNICFKKIIDEFNKRNEIVICMSLNHKALKNNVYFINYEYNENENLKEINDSTASLYINGKKINLEFFLNQIKKVFML